MPSKIGWLRISYWAAALADVLNSILILIPEMVGETGFRYSMGLASAPALSWAVILLLADRKPAERRWVLLPTILVIALLESAGLYSVYLGVIPKSSILFSSIMAMTLIALCSFSYYNSSDL